MGVSKLFQQAGYYTDIVGKWHLKSQPTGFDYYNVVMEQGNYFDSAMSKSGIPWWRIEGDKPETYNPEGIKKHMGYATDIITDISLNFLQERPKDKPFLLRYHQKAPHDWFEYDSKYAYLYESMAIPEPRPYLITIKIGARPSKGPLKNFIWNTIKDRRMLRNCLLKGG